MSFDFVKDFSIKKDSKAALRESALKTALLNGFPTSKNEDWKYTNIKYLEKLNFSRGVPKAPLSEETQKVCFHNGELAYHPKSENKGLSFQVVSTLDFEKESTDPFYNLNTAFHGDAVEVRISKDTVIESPIWIEHGFSGVSGLGGFPRINVIVESGAKAKFVERYESSGADSLYCPVVNLTIEENANVEWFAFQDGSKDSFCFYTGFAKIKKNAHLKQLVMSTGGRVFRMNSHMEICENSDVDMDGAYICEAGQHCDFKTLADHVAPHGRSRQYYKGILTGNGRSVFNGKVKISERAQYVDSSQLNKNLVLDPRAEADTKPELEVYADDVQAIHGATVGQLNPEELFYLMSRGLPESVAKRMLLKGYIDEFSIKYSLAEKFPEISSLIDKKLSVLAEGLAEGHS